MKLVTFGIDRVRNLIIQFPVFIQPYIQQPLILYQIETVPVPVVHQNKHADSYTHLQIDRPYIALISETYISIRQQELRTCKRIGPEFYCEELFVVKHKSKYSCERATYFDLGQDMIKENCKFPDDKHIICNVNNDIPVKIPSNPYVLVNRSILCNVV